MKKDDILQRKSFEFAILTVRISDQLKAEKRGFEIASQLIRSGTAVAALIREAEHGESSRDFLHKMNIALKKVNECRFWMELILAVGYFEEARLKPAVELSTELFKMLVATVKTIKAKLINEKNQKN